MLCFKFHHMKNLTVGGVKFFRGAPRGAQGPDFKNSKKLHNERQYQPIPKTELSKTESHTKINSLTEKSFLGQFFKFSGKMRILPESLTTFEQKKIVQKNLEEVFVNLIQMLTSEARVQNLKTCENQGRSPQPNIFFSPMDFFF